MDTPLEQTHRRSRRWFLPVVVVLVGSGIAVWASQRETKRMAEVEHAVAALVRDACAGRDVTAQLHSPDPLMKTQIIAAIQTLCGPGNTSAVTVNVTPGDVEAGGRFSGSATHVAIVDSVDGGRLGLRVQHSGNAPRVVILGYFAPGVGSAAP